MRNACLIFIAMVGLSLSLFAHEGHNKIPGNIQAPHGGKIKGTDNLYIELVQAESNLKFYVFDHDLKAIPMNEVELSGDLKLPKKQNTQKIEFVKTESAFSTNIDAKGSHRYSVDLAFKFKGKKEKLSFTVEP
jgi:hypothetical protein